MKEKGKSEETNIVGTFLHEISELADTLNDRQQGWAKYSDLQICGFLTYFRIRIYLFDIFSFDNLMDLNFQITGILPEIYIILIL